MPTKTGRNDPCPCGSGQKYKRCCLERDQAAASQSLAAQAAKAAAKHANLMATMHDHDHHDGCDFCGHDHNADDEATRSSNAAFDLVHDDNLDKAE